jgi:hypothetical protein
MVYHRSESKRASLFSGTLWTSKHAGKNSRS